MSCNNNNVQELLKDEMCRSWRLDPHAQFMLKLKPIALANIGFMRTICSLPIKRMCDCVVNQVGMFRGNFGRDWDVFY